MTSADYSEADAPDPTGDSAVLSFAAADGAGERLDRFLARTIADVSRTRIQRWIDLGAVWCDSRTLSAKTRLLGSELLFVQPMPLEADQSFEPDPVQIEVIDESPQWLVINKPAGLVVHPGTGNWRWTLLNGLLHHWPRQAELPRAGIVHRLDKDTSGLLVVARTEAARHSFTEQLRDRSMGRRYLAFVRGSPALRGTIDAAIGRDPSLRTRMAVVTHSAGKVAVTDYRLLAKGSYDKQSLAVLACDLRSGRTHQIRAHMAHVGHPLLGDSLYGGPSWAISRQALHAWRLGLVDPSTGQRRQWQIKPPPDIDALAAATAIDLTAVVAACAS